MISVLTPKNQVREIKALKTAKSQSGSHTKGTSDNESFSTQLDKATHYIKRQIAHDFHFRDYSDPKDLVMSSFNFSALQSTKTGEKSKSKKLISNI